LYDFGTIIEFYLFLLNIFNFVGQFFDDLDHKWHGKVHNTISPGKFQDNIWFDEVIASVAAD
jgi:hypothetical protein